jgi:hypothetical protein
VVVVVVVGGGGCGGGERASVVAAVAVVVAVAVAVVIVISARDSGGSGGGGGTPHFSQIRNGVGALTVRAPRARTLAVRLTHPCTANGQGFSSGAPSEERKPFCLFGIDRRRGLVLIPENHVVGFLAYRSQHISVARPVKSNAPTWELNDVHLRAERREMWM